MSNKLKTLSKSQLEKIISEGVSNYLHEDCKCTISEMSTPNIDEENEEDTHEINDLSFKVQLHYEEDD